MSPVPNTFVDGTIADADDVNANFTALAPADLAARSVLEVGVVNQTRAGRQFAVTDFTTLLGLSTPVGLWNLGSTANLGSGGALTNKGSVTFAKGVTGTASEAAQFTGSTAQALYIADTGGADPFRIKTGTVGCWMRTAKRATVQGFVTKYAAAGGAGFLLDTGGDNLPRFIPNVNGTNQAAIGVTDIADDRWHFVVGTYDGSVVRVYVDGALEGSLSAAGTMSGDSAPLNIGNRYADAGAAGGSPHYGRIDEAFVIADVLTEEQIRLLMSVKIAHGLSVTPRVARVGLRRRKRGPVLAQADFTTAPLRLYNLANAESGGAADDLGTNNVDATFNVASAAGSAIDGPDGKQSGASYFNGSSVYVSATDTGLPSGTSARTLGAWFKTTSASGAQKTIVGYGNANRAELRVSNSAGSEGKIEAVVGGTSCAGVYAADGQWHHALVVADDAAADGVRLKLYLDGRLVGTSSTALGSTTLGGAGYFTIGRQSAAASDYFPGSIARVFVTNYAMAQDEISNLYAKASSVVGNLIVPSLDEQPVDQIVQGMDATNLYVLGDVRKRISGRVNSDGSVAEMVGGDFRVVRTGTGDYTIYWAPGTFTTPPALTVTPQVGSALMPILSTTQAAGYQRLQIVTSASAVTDSAFHFTAEARGPIPSQHQLDLGVQP